MAIGETEILWLLPLILVAKLAHADVAPLNVDNSALNQRDRNVEVQTADRQARGTHEDVDLTRQIRRELMQDSSLSTYAKNAKIITLGGVTTLRGPVHSEAERHEVGLLAERIVGKERVMNELEVKQ